MEAVNPVVVYYDVLLPVSVLLTGIYMFIWNKHYDAHITVVFMLVPVACLGYTMPAHSTVLPEALADVYDALVSKRVYKEKMSFEQADRIMMEGMGSQFAPEMRDVYCRARPKLEEYYREQEKGKSAGE